MVCSLDCVLRYIFLLNLLGLGTSTPKEAKEYFAAMSKHKIPFEYAGDPDTQCIDMAFSKKKVEERKEWLRLFKPGTFLDHSVQSITYSDFINKVFQ